MIDSRRGTGTLPPFTVYFYRLLRLPEELASWLDNVTSHPL
jgi:hypothetical protein